MFHDGRCLSYATLPRRPSVQTRLLEQELTAARDEAAAATAHMKQFQALATSSNQALRDMEVNRRARRSPTSQ